MWLLDCALPELEATYRIDPAQRTFIGHSLSGLFGLFTLFTLSNLPSQPPPRLTSPSTLPTPSSPPPPPPLQANGMTALSQACSKGHQEAVCVLLELGASLHYTNVCVSVLCWLHTACRAALLLQG